MYSLDWWFLYLRIVEAFSFPVGGANCKFFFFSDLVRIADQMKRGGIRNAGNDAEVEGLAVDASRLRFIAGEFNVAFAGQTLDLEVNLLAGGVLSLDVIAVVELLDKDHVFEARGELLLGELHGEDLDAIIGLVLDATCVEEVAPGAQGLGIGTAGNVFCAQEVSAGHVALVRFPVGIGFELDGKENVRGFADLLALVDNPEFLSHERVQRKVLLAILA